jgi:hypothetical protein
MLPNWENDKQGCDFIQICLNTHSLCRLYDNFFVFALHCSVGIAPIQGYTPLFPLNKQLASILLYED